MNEVHTKSINELKRLSRYAKKVAVAYSGGKDSLCVLDLCLEHFDEVVAFHMYFIPDLRSEDERLEYARRRWGVKILEYPHWTLPRALKAGAYNFEPKAVKNLPEYTVRDIYTLVRRDTGAQLVATGAKSGDSMWRKYWLANTAKSGNWDDVINPIDEWNKFDVLAWLQMRGIPKPDSSGCAASGLDLSEPEILHLFDHYPDDFEKLERVFPLVGAVVKRRDWYGDYKQRRRETQEERAAAEAEAN